MRSYMRQSHHIYYYKAFKHFANFFVSPQPHGPLNSCNPFNLDSEKSNA